MNDDYKGPDSIGYVTFPGRGRTYLMDIEGHRIQVAVSEKARKVRVFVDGDERT